jgi:D-glycero-alpha-D-manno-heptose 1-phosphate guanylyltransferase
MTASESIGLEDVEPVVLVGGRGTRLQRALPHVPKPMAPVAGRPFVEWIIRHLARGGFRRVILSTGHLGHIVEEHFAGRPVPGVDVRCIREEQPLGTAGAFLHIVELTKLAPPLWLVLNGDSLIFVDWPALVAQFHRAELDALVVARRLDDTGRFGRLVVDASNRLLAFNEKSSHASEPGWINAGIYLLRRQLVCDCPSQRPLAFEFDLFPAWLHSGRHVEVYPVPTEFLDIGTEQTLPQAESLIRRHEDCFR